jgi:DNA-binding NarL/FixJ family response regulator
MPPGNTDDGLVAAAELRRSHPRTAVLVLSQYLEPFYMLELVGDSVRASAICSRTAYGTFRNSSTRSKEWPPAVRPSIRTS